MSSSSSRSPSNSGGATMKQRKLNFPSSKRTVSATKAKKVVNTASGSDTPAHDHSLVDTTSIVPKIGTEREDTARKLTATRDSLGSHKEGSPIDQVQPDPRPELNIKDPRWRKLFAQAKAERNGLPLAHGNKEDEISQILRVFDLNYDYGPCIGVSRLERWERAHALGLNPPLEIREILSTRQGLEKYSDCVFHGEV